jgi:pseudaminic acid biosynthesis-associated methylase
MRRPNEPVPPVTRTALPWRTLTLSKDRRDQLVERASRTTVPISFTVGGGAMVSDEVGDDNDAARLERLWAGDFGDAYSDRNADAGAGRKEFWDTLLTRYPMSRVLEVGCNTGANLQWIAPHLATGEAFGVDVNREALARLRQRIPTINALESHARELPFRDDWFDLAFTTGVLIHQPESTLHMVMGEVVRVSRRFVLCGEYFAPETTEIQYRDVPGSLFKRDYGRLYREQFPELRIVDQGHLGRAEGWDDVTWWLFEKA